MIEKRCLATNNNSRKCDRNPTVEIFDLMISKFHTFRFRSDVNENKVDLLQLVFQWLSAKFSDRIKNPVRFWIWRFWYRKICDFRKSEILIIWFWLSDFSVPNVTRFHYRWCKDWYSDWVVKGAYYYGKAGGTFFLLVQEVTIVFFDQKRVDLMIVSRLNPIE